MKKNLVKFLAIFCLGILVAFGCKKKDDDSGVVINKYPVRDVTMMPNGEGKVTITWKAPEKGLPLKYNLYKNDKLYKVISETSYTDDLDGANTYCVAALYAVGESEKVCVDMMTENVDPILGNYLGYIDILLNDEPAGGVPDVTISIEKVSESKAKVIVNQNLPIELPGVSMIVPIKLSEEVSVMEYEGEYAFAFTSSVNVEGFPIPLPLQFVGAVKEGELMAAISVNVAALGIDVECLYTGTKQ